MSAGDDARGLAVGPPRRASRSSRGCLAAGAARACCCVALALAVAPAWNPVWYQDDQLPTLFRTFHTDLAHHWGVLYPRLAPELGFGYGRLLHQFYPPFGVELAAWLHTLGLGFVDAARATFSLCLLSSALGMYAYGRAVLAGAGRRSLAAIGFVWAPYVLLDAHKGGVLGESIAMALMPWSLLASTGWCGRRLAAFGAAAGSWRWSSWATTSRRCSSSGWPASTRAAGWRPSNGSRGPASASGGRHVSGASAGAAGAVRLALALAAIYWLPALAGALRTAGSPSSGPANSRSPAYLVAPPTCSSRWSCSTTTSRRCPATGWRRTC